MRPLVMPLLPCGDAHERLVPTVRIGSQIEHYGWPAGRGTNLPGRVRAVDAADALAAIPQKQRRTLYWEHLAACETSTPEEFHGGEIDCERAATTGRIEPGPTRVTVQALADGIRRTGAKPALIVANCETGTDPLVKWLLANGATLTQRRRIPDARVGAALTMAAQTGYHTANYNALMVVLHEYAAKIVGTLLAELLKPLTDLKCTVALSLASHTGGVHPWVLPSFWGAPVTPWPLPKALANAPQVYGGGKPPLDELAEYPAWAGFLLGLDCIRANVAGGQKVYPIFATPGVSNLNADQWEVFFAHAARSMGAPAITPLWNEHAQPGQVAAVAETWTRACGSATAKSRDPRQIDFAAPSVSSGDLTTTRDDFEKTGS